MWISPGGDTKNGEVEENLTVLKAQHGRCFPRKEGGWTKSAVFKFGQGAHPVAEKVCFLIHQCESTSSIKFCLTKILSSV